MKSRYIASISIFILAGAVYGIFFRLSSPSSSPAHATDLTPQTKKTITETPPKPLPDMAKPYSFTVPSLNLTVPVETVGLTSNGDMDVPASETSLGWYENGAFPGNAGPAVLAGHTGLPEKPSPFRKLESLKKGDTIKVKDVAGTTASFQIIETATYTPESAPRERIFGATTTARLAIITCSGEWIPKQKTYSHRLVLYSVRTSDSD